MTSKNEVVKFLKGELEEAEHRRSSKDVLGKFKWCPASRAAYSSEARYYKYLLNKLRAK